VKKIILLLALVLMGCSQLGWDDLPEASVRPVSNDPTVSQEEWEMTVKWAIWVWNSDLERAGCPAAFKMVDVGGHPIELIPDAEWDDGTSLGYTWGDEDYQPAGGVHIRNRVDAHPTPAGVLLHELGHGIGLGHADPAWGQSIMMIGGERDHLEPRDIRAAACLLNCGPCDSKDDPYNIP
jgi:hypothetical protein